MAVGLVCEADTGWQADGVSSDQYLVAVQN